MTASIPKEKGKRPGWRTPAPTKDPKTSRELLFSRGLSLVKKGKIPLQKKKGRGKIFDMTPSFQKRRASPSAQTRIIFPPYSSPRGKQISIN